MKRVLFIAYEFPPTGGAGVQRTTKFVKYLPQFGWQPTVLTVSNPSVPVRDDSLCNDIPPKTPIVRCRTLEPGYRFKAAVNDANDQASLASRSKRMVKSLVNCFLTPDPQILWAPAALQTGKQMLREVPHDAIFATGPPFSSLVIGRRLSRWSGVPLVVDYRDEWSISNKHRENRTATGPSAWWQATQEAAVLRQASAAIATTRSSAVAIRERCSQSNSKAATHEIYNGYDPDDFVLSANSLPAFDGVLRVCYVGTLWNLTDVSPLVTSTIELCERSAEFARKLELTFVGRRTAAQDALLNKLHELPVRLNRMPYLEHRQAIELMRSSSLLCLLLSDSPESPRVVPAKLFEYIATNRPILAVAPRGEVWELLDDYPAANCFEPGEISRITTFLTNQIEDMPRASTSPNSDASRFSRVAQAEQLSRIFAELSPTKCNAPRKYPL